MNFTLCIFLFSKQKWLCFLIKHQTLYENSSFFIISTKKKKKCAYHTGISFLVLDDSDQRKRASNINYFIKIPIVIFKYFFHKKNLAKLLKINIFEIDKVLFTNYLPFRKKKIITFIKFVSNKLKKWVFKVVFNCD